METHRAELKVRCCASACAGGLRTAPLPGHDLGGGRALFGARAANCMRGGGRLSCGFGRENLHGMEVLRCLRRHDPQGTGNVLHRYNLIRSLMVSTRSMKWISTA